MSTRSSDTVERVVNSSPHEQRTVVTLYSGWMPCFIGCSQSSRSVVGALDPIPGTTCAVPAFHSPFLVDVGALDVAQELGVGLGLAHPVHHQLEGLGGLEGAEDPAQLPGHDQLLLGQ